MIKTTRMHEHKYKLSGNFGVKTVYVTLSYFPQLEVFLDGCSVLFLKDVFNYIFSLELHSVA